MDLSERNLYKILGVQEDSDGNTIKGAYRAAALKFHPDRNLGLSKKEQDDLHEIMLKINEAYEVLGDPALKALYDSGARTGSGEAIRTDKVGDQAGRAGDEQSAKAEQEARKRAAEASAKATEETRVYNEARAKAAAKVEARQVADATAEAAVREYTKNKPNDFRNFFGL